jgi:NCS1 family nucleobase:cation symporter-1
VDSGAIAGVLITDYWLVRQKRLQLGDLYRREGMYTYLGGWNWRAIVATVVGCTLAWIGLIVPTLRPLYDYAWFVGFGAAAITHYLLMRAFPARSLH